MLMTRGAEKYGFRTNWGEGQAARRSRTASRARLSGTSSSTWPGTPKRTMWLRGPLIFLLFFL